MPEYKKVGRYSIIKKIGEGVYGKVYLAKESGESSPVALKWTLKNDSPTRAELKVMNNIKPHENVARLLEHFTAPQAACLAYEYCEGGDLNHWIQENGEVPLPLSICWALDMAQGVQAVHDAGFLHCDLKTDNVLLKYNRRLDRYQLKLIDFGLARQLKSHGCGSKRLVPEVESGPYYSSAPEVFDGSPVTTKADVFSLGLLYLSMFHPIVVDDGTFRLAAVYVTDQKYWGKALREVPQTVITRIVNTYVPDELKLLIVEMLQLKPERRPALPVVISVLRKTQRTLSTLDCSTAKLGCAVEKLGISDSGSVINTVMATVSVA